ncbi:MAG: 1-acyl-sn-glycerol-3-phosphate acyltransferase [Lachnospiraceae bacterium]|nr:1-acyl-sn-glycerol-3-phosphate acyltransferase [Lachnospiraceae bacterium]
MLLNWIAIISLVSSMLGYFLSLYKLIFIPVAFLAVYLSLVLLWFLVAFIVTRPVDLTKEYEKRSGLYRWFVNCIVETMRQVCRVDLKVSGREKLPKEKFLLVCNHRGILDPLLTMDVLRKWDMGFVAKAVIYKIPIICRLMHRSYCLCLNRDDMRSSAKTIARAAYFIKNDFASMGIYPEGIRSQEDEMLPFMHGAFKIAKMAACPIVVTTITDTEKATRYFWKKTVVHLDFIDIIEKDVVAENTTVNLSNMAREKMEKNLAQYK